jgi:ribosomal protein L7/L12
MQLDQTSPDPRIQRAADAIRAGNAIEAIKYLRDATGMSLREAKETVEKLMDEQGTPPMAAAGEDLGQIFEREGSEPERALPEPLEDRIRALVANENYVEAVTLVRDVTGADTKTARHRVEQMAGQNRTTGKAWLPLLIGIIVLLLGLMVMMMG